MKSKFFSLLIIIFSISSSADTEGLASPNGKYLLFENCEKESGQNCTVYARPKNSTLKTWIIKDPFPSSPYMKWFNDDLARVLVSCGSPCNATFFYSPKKGVSAPYSLVMAVEEKRQLVVVPFYDSKSDKRSIQVFSIFSPDKPILEINRNFGDYIQFVQESEFDDQGDLHISYFERENPSKTTEEVIKIKY